MVGHLLRRLYWRVRRPTTLGVRCLVVRGGDVLLVRHTYAPWWYLPGGGVRRGESFVAAARREVLEETGLRVDGLRPLGVYLNRREGKIDHVVVFLADAPESAPQPDQAEVRDARFFRLDDPPADTSPATRRRLAEHLNGQMPAEEW
jgi:8-oxo-dGTP pyrophosphatase MutT (NUDIX family)